MRVTPLRTAVGLAGVLTAVLAGAPATATALPPDSPGVSVIQLPIPSQLAGFPGLTAAPGPLTAPTFAFQGVERTGPYAGQGKWVWTINPVDYGGARGTITFYDDAFRGPRGADPNTFEVRGTGGFDAGRLSFTQTVNVIPRDGMTADPASTIFKDDPVGLAMLAGSRMNAVNMDGQVSLGEFGWTTPPGTKFANMKIDRAGNYYVARKDMDWGFFDYVTDQKGTPQAGSGSRRLATNFDFQPYPLSDAYGFCGSVLTPSPHAFVKQRGQLIFDVAFDVTLGLTKHLPGASRVAASQVINGFIARSYGTYVVDVVNPLGQRQYFVGHASTVNTNPATGKLERGYYQHVSPIAAGVVPTGSWVVGHGATLRIVPPGTPGARYHRNLFAGFAYLLRADMMRSVMDQPGVDYRNRATWTDYPAR